MAKVSDRFSNSVHYIYMYVLIHCYTMSEMSKGDLRSCIPRNVVHDGVVTRLQNLKQPDLNNVAI